MNKWFHLYTLNDLIFLLCDDRKMNEKGLIYTNVKNDTRLAKN